MGAAGPGARPMAPRAGAWRAPPMAPSDAGRRPMEEPMAPAPTALLPTAPTEGAQPGKPTLARQPGRPPEVTGEAPGSCGGGAAGSPPGWLPPRAEGPRNAEGSIWERCWPMAPTAARPPPMVPMTPTGRCEGCGLPTGPGGRPPPPAPGPAARRGRAACPRDQSRVARTAARASRPPPPPRRGGAAGQRAVGPCGLCRAGLGLLLGVTLEELADHAAGHHVGREREVRERLAGEG